MATPQLRIDASLGNGWYREWQEMDGQAKAQEARYNASRMRLKLPITSPLLDRIYDDLVILNKIEKDYQQGMGVILSGRRLASTEQLKRVHDLYTLALGCADQENDILEALFATGFAAAWVLFPWVLLQAKANSMLDALAKLRRALKEAEHEVSNARNKRAFHLAVAFFEAMFPEISLTARVGIFLSDVAVDKVLGPKHPSAAQKYTGIATPGVKQFSEAVHHIEEYGSTAHAIAEKTGKVATVATFYFDYKEIAEGTEVVEKLTELTEKVEKAHEDLAKVIADNRPMINQFLAAYERWMRKIDDIRITGGNTREALGQDMTRYGVSRTAPVVWQALP